jgi:hypothetical protein
MGECHCHRLCAPVFVRLFLPLKVALAPRGKTLGTESDLGCPLPERGMAAFNVAPPVGPVRTSRDSSS